MKHSNLLYSRKLRQFRSLSKKVNRLLASGKFSELSTSARERMAQRLRHLYHLLSKPFSGAGLRKMLAAASLLLGLGASAQAQTNINFVGPTTNPYGLTQIPSSYLLLPETVDIDADGDQDILAYANYGLLKYYENTGTAQVPAFAAAVDFPFSLDTTESYAFIAFADLDADGDFDMMSGSDYGSFDYYENIGDSATPDFAVPVSVPFGLDSTYGLSIPEFVDLDGDGDFDLLVGEYYGEWQYYENVGDSANPAFAAAVPNPFGLSSAYYYGLPTVQDLDSDGDFDLLAGNYYGEFRYYENTGTATAPSFAPYLSNPFGLQSGYNVADPVLTDLDGDGDFDLLVGEYNGNWQFYKMDTTAVSAAEPQPKLPLNIAPNPASERIEVSVDVEGTEQEGLLTVVSMRGRRVLSRTVAVQGGRMETHVDLQSLPAGNYLVRLKVGDQLYRKRFAKQ